MVVATAEGQDEPEAKPKAKLELRGVPLPAAGEPERRTKSAGVEGVDETKSGLALKECASWRLADRQPDNE